MKLGTWDGLVENFRGSGSENEEPRRAGHVATWQLRALAIGALPSKHLTRAAQDNGILNSRSYSFVAGSHCLQQASAKLHYC